jgi:hypothetical protein
MSLNRVFHLVTAKHLVISDTRSLKDLNIYVNGNDGHIDVIDVDEVKDTMQVEWITHENKHVDLAVLPFPIYEGTFTKRIQDNLVSGIDEISLLDDVFFLSYQPEIKIDRVDPIIRTGCISLINNDKSFYIDGTVFPGNSGSPVFFKPSPYYIKGKEYFLSPNPFRFPFTWDN